MSVIDVKARVTISGPLKMFNRLRNFDPKPTLVTLKKPANVDQNQHDTAARGPDGPWPQLAPSTVARNRYARTVGKGKGRRTIRKGHGGSARLISRHKLLGRLPKARQSIVSRKSLIVRSRVKWSMAHQAGARVGRGSLLPRRQFEWISPWLKRQVVAAFERDLNAAAGAI